MRKLTFAFIACLTFIQALQADATSFLSLDAADAPTLLSPVNLSLQHFESLTKALSANQDFQNIISDGEFITAVQIQKRSFNVQEGNVYVDIATRLIDRDKDTVAQEAALPNSANQAKLMRFHNPTKKRRSRTSKNYVATLMLTPSEIGPPSVTVVSIEPAGHRAKRATKGSNLSQTPSYEYETAAE